MSPLTPLLLLALTAIPGARQEQGSYSLTCTACEEDMRDSLASIYVEGEQREDRARAAQEEFRAQIETLKNATAQLLEELSVVRGRQAASSAVQASQVILLLGYFITILVIFCIKRCKKHQEEVAKAEFELLEANLRSSKARRRAAAAKEKSAQAQDLE